MQSKSTADALHALDDAANELRRLLPSKHDADGGADHLPPRERLQAILYDRLIQISNTISDNQRKSDAVQSNVSLLSSLKSIHEQESTHLAALKTAKVKLVRGRVLFNRHRKQSHVLTRRADGSGGAGAISRPIAEPSKQKVTPATRKPRFGGRASHYSASARAPATPGSSSGGSGDSKRAAAATNVEFMPIGEAEFAGVSDFIKGKVQLEDVNRCWLAIFGELYVKNRASLSLAQINAMNIKCASKTERAKITVLRALQRVKLSPDESMVYPIPIAKRKWLA